MKSFLKLLSITLYVLLLLFVTGKLFFEERFDHSLNYLKKTFLSKTGESLTIALSEPALSLSPLTNDVASRARLLHIYEPLVRVTPDLQIEPGLAISYGSINDLTWEFRIRSGVFFHNGKPLTMDDVLFSLNEAKNSPASSLKDLASGMKELTKIDEQIFQILTEKPDPLLLPKLSLLLIFQKGTPIQEIIGTGPYRFEKSEGKTFILTKFENYWGGTQSPFERVTIQTFGSREEKIKALEEKRLDILANVPPDTALNFQFPGFRMRTLPTLEVNFLMFHMEKIFREKPLREAVALALNPTELAKLTQGFAVPVNQFVGNGIFGYDPMITPRMQNLKKAEELVKSVANFFRIQATLDLPRGLEVFGFSVQERLRKIGIDVKLNFVSFDRLHKKITKRESEFFFFGWKAELGDSSDFLTAVVHSPEGEFGQFNGGNYRNAIVDRFIEESQETLKQSLRLEKLRAAMKIITVEDIIGVPLFSPEIPYAVSTRLKWKPRVDGYVLAQEVDL